MYNEPNTSISLIWRARKNEPDAWKTLCEIYAPLVFSWAKRAGLQGSDAGDIVQEVFGALSNNLDRLELEGPNRKFRAWLWTVTRNALRKWFRESENGRGRGGTDALNQIHAIPDWVENDAELTDIDPEDTAEIELLHRAAEHVRRDFEQHTWQAFWRVTVEGESAVDVAADLGMKPAAVRQAKFRVLVRLRELLW